MGVDVWGSGIRLCRWTCFFYAYIYIYILKGETCLPVIVIKLSLQCSSAFFLLWKGLLTCLVYSGATPFAERNTRERGAP